MAELVVLCVRSTARPLSGGLCLGGSIRCSARSQWRARVTQELRRTLASLKTPPTSATTKQPPRPPGTTPSPGKLSPTKPAGSVNLTPDASKSHSEAKAVYPEALLIYSAGAARTLFVTSIRLGGIFVWIAASLLIAPSYYYDPFQPTWMAPVVVVGGAIPLLIMSWTSYPLVTFIHLFLPHWARTSSARLHRYTQSLPSTAVMELATVRYIWPRITRLKASELYIKTGRMGSMTVRRNVPEAVKQARKWWMYRPLTGFHVAGASRGKIPERGIWEEVLTCIYKGWQKRETTVPVNAVSRAPKPTPRQ